MSRPLSIKLIEDTARELMARAAIDIPPDYRAGVRLARDGERNKLARFVLTEMDNNWDIATADRRPVSADTGLPRYYVRAGNEALVDGGFVALERALRRATADATASIPLRPNRVHPLTRVDHDNNVGIHAPEITYAFEPGGDWIDITTVHKGGLFGSDYRMLFPADGVGGIKRFFVDTLVQFGKRGLACQPAIVGLGIGGSKDTCVRLGKEAACLRAVGSRNPDSAIAPGHGPNPSRRTSRVSLRPDVVHRLLPPRGDRMNPATACLRPPSVAPGSWAPFQTIPATACLRPPSVAPGSWAPLQTILATACLRPPSVAPGSWAPLQTIPAGARQ